MFSPSRSGHFSWVWNMKGVCACVYVCDAVECERQLLFTPLQAPLGNLFCAHSSASSRSIEKARQLALCPSGSRFVTHFNATPETIIAKFDPICSVSADTPPGPNKFVKVPAGKTVVGKSANFPSYGWDNEYGGYTAE